MNGNGSSDKKLEFGLPTRGLAKLCHSCGICPYAAKKPGSTFEQIMRWHRTWCPGWNSHTKVYGLKPLG